MRDNYGDNLLGFLNHHKDKLSGIINGIDYTYRDGEQPKGWHPGQDTCIKKNYTVADLNVGMGRIPNKNQCKMELQKEIGLKEDESKPLIGLLGRLEPQKGIVLLPKDFSKNDESKLRNLGIQLLICGRPGDDAAGKHIRQELTKYAKSFSDWLRVDMTFVPEKFVHQLFAGCDMILMPSEYEPGGMPQMQGHRYGAIPIVRKTGGLADTVTDGVDGFVFGSGSWGTDEGEMQSASDSMLEAITRAVDTYRNNPREWGNLIRNAMNRDHTWEASARQYIELYNSALSNKS